jgi:hypothetical protein
MFARCVVLRRVRSVSVRRGRIRTVWARLPLVWVVLSPCRARWRWICTVAWSEVDVGPCEGERFGDARAGADEQFGEWSVVSWARAQVAIDFVEAQVGELAMLGR